MAAAGIIASLSSLADARNYCGRGLHPYRGVAPVVPYRGWGYGHNRWHDYNYNWAAPLTSE